MALPPIAAINLTGNCRLRCPFCYGPTRDTQTLDPKTWCAILEFLTKHGVRILIIGGGEPLLFPELKEILKFARSKRFRTILATSCPSHKAVLEVASFFDWFEISLHGSKAEIHATAGGSVENYSVVLEVLSSLTAMSNPKLKVNTVVTSQNVDDMPNIARLIARYRVNTWKLFEVRPRGAAFSSNPENIRYRFTKKIIRFLESVVRDALNQMPSTRVVLSQASSGDNAYLIIYPDGRVLIPQGTKYIDIGDISSIQSWSKYKEDAFIQAANAYIANQSVVREFETSFERLS